MATELTLEIEELVSLTQIFNHHMVVHRYLIHLRPHRKTMAKMEVTGLKRI